MQQDLAVARVLERLGDLENYPEAHLAPYEEFRIGAKIYYFTPGGFLYRKDPGSEEVGGFFVATSRTRSGATAPTTVS